MCGTLTTSLHRQASKLAASVKTLLGRAHVSEVAVFLLLLAGVLALARWFQGGVIYSSEQKAKRARAAAGKA